MKKRILIRDLTYYRQCLEELAPFGMIRIFVARHEGRPVAAGISTRFGQTAMLLHMSNDYSVANAGWAIQWEMIKWAIAEGCSIYDFAGTGTSYPPKETDKGYGVYQFKLSFGAKIVVWYGYADYVCRPGAYKIFRVVEQCVPYGEQMFLDLQTGVSNTRRFIRGFWNRSVDRKTDKSKAA